MLERHSALAGHLGGEPRLGVDRRLQLTIGEVRGWSLTQIAGFPATIAAVETAIRELTGTAPPATASRPVCQDASTIFRTGHNQFWIIGAADSGLASRALARIDGGTGAVTELSHSRCRIFIDGPPAAEVLKKGIAIDFDGGFPVGAAAMTGVHHTPTLLHRATASRYEIVAMRTFAVAVFEWLTDAALEFGYEVPAA